jgi:hypothetical protein
MQEEFRQKGILFVMGERQNSPNARPASQRHPVCANANRFFHYALCVSGQLLPKTESTPIALLSALRCGDVNKVTVVTEPFTKKNEKRECDSSTSNNAHLNGKEAVRVYQHAARLFGIGLTYSMTHPEEMDDVRAVLGEQYARRIEQLHGEGVRIAKSWSAPRSRNLEENIGLPGALRLDAPHILESMSTAAGLGMAFMDAASHITYSVNLPLLQ